MSVHVSPRQPRPPLTSSIPAIYPQGPVPVLSPRVCGLTGTWRDTPLLQRADTHTYTHTYADEEREEGDSTLCVDEEAADREVAFLMEMVAQPEVFWTGEGAEAGVSVSLQMGGGSDATAYTLTYTHTHSSTSTAAAAPEWQQWKGEGGSRMMEESREEREEEEDAEVQMVMSNVPMALCEPLVGAAITTAAWQY